MASPAKIPNHTVWKALEAYEIGPADAAFTFAQRLARENRWTADFTASVIEEYRRFCFLTVVAGHDVTPSDAVDQAWHLHLTYSRDYWQQFCPEVLGVDMHHGPTAGGGAERSRYYEQYAATLARYEQAFGEAPPADIWPAAQRRFNTDPKGVRVNSADVIIIARPVYYASAVGILFVLAALIGFIVWGVG